MSVKGTVTTSDYIEFDRATAIGEKLLKDEKLKIIGLYVIVSINCGLRVSDVLALKGENFKADTIKLVEGKTNKKREIKINDNIRKALKSLNISTHSMRKSFGRRVYESCGESEKALNYLSELFNHSSISITRKYLGIRQEELNNIYDCIV